MSYIDKRSGKRFHRKRFNGHVINDYKHQREDEKPDAGLTNKRKHELRAEARRDIFNMRREMGI